MNLFYGDPFLFNWLSQHQDGDEAKKISTNSSADDFNNHFSFEMQKVGFLEFISGQNINKENEYYVLLCEKKGKHTAEPIFGNVYATMTAATAVNQQ